MKNKQIIYDINKEYAENMYYGPFWDAPLPKIPQTKSKKTFMGYKVNSLIGVPSCPLTVTPRYVKLYSRLGFDILTYKSVRSVEWHGNIYPHWRYVESNVLPVKDISPPTLQARTSPVAGKDTTQVNSFGIHSLKPEYWQEEYEIAQEHLLPGQLLILSMMLTPVEGRTTVDDARMVAQYSKETTAKIFEINLSCPNTEGGGGLIYDDVELSVEICKAIKKIIKSKPLLVKVGYYKEQEKLKTFMQRTQKIIAGLSSMNTYVAKVHGTNKKEAFPGRSMAGLSGAAIRGIALHQVKNAAIFRKELGLKDFTILGIGGITKTKHFDDYFKIGASAAQVAAGAYTDPFLAYKYKTK